MSTTVKIIVSVLVILLLGVVVYDIMDAVIGNILPSSTQYFSAIQ